VGKAIGMLNNYFKYIGVYLCDNGGHQEKPDAFVLSGIVGEELDIVHQQ